MMKKPLTASRYLPLILAGLGLTWGACSRPDFEEGPGGTGGPGPAGGGMVGAGGAGVAAGGTGVGGDGAVATAGTGAGGDGTVVVVDGEIPAQCSAFTPTRVIELPDPVESPDTQSMLQSLQLDQKIRLMYGWEGCSYNEGFQCFINQGIPEAGVPDWRLHDGPRGVRTLASITASTTFPTSVARAASFDIDLEQRIGAVIGVETLAQTRDVMLSPAIDTLRNPRWGRAQEVYGEDPVLLGHMGAALVRGIQDHAPACIKHFTANTTEDNRTTMNAEMDEQTLRENYVRQFRIAIELSDPSCVMAAYNQVNGTFSAENRHLLTELLREEWGWKGFVVSDWGAAQSTVPSANAGLDLEMPNAVHYGNLGSQVPGQVSGERVDEAVGRILNVRYHWNQMSDEHFNRPPNPAVVDTPGHDALALEAAVKGMVLLENKDAILPFQAGQNILVVGPDGNEARLGDRGSSEVEPAPQYRTTPFSGLSAIGTAVGAAVSYEPDLAAAVAAAPAATAVVLVVSMEHTDEGEGFGGGGDRENLHLGGPHPKLWPEGQKPREWITQLAAANPNLVVVLNTGSAIVGEPALESAKGLVYSFYPGQAGGTALGQLLFGTDGAGNEVNFSGKLPFTIANAETEYPEFGNNTASVTYPYLHGYRKFDAEALAPRYAFGAGLSYTTFTYENLAVPCSAGVSPGGLLIAEVDVTNSGMRTGTEIVQLYVGYPNTAARRPPKELKAWARVTLGPGETQRVQLQVPAGDLAYFDMTSNSWQLEPVEHTVLVGPNADNATLLPASFTVLPQ